MPLMKRNEPSSNNMKEVTVVTGPMRSGTSCITGLLECCGFDLGRNVRVLRNRTEHNPKGHFEADLLFTINARLLEEVPGGRWSVVHPPEEQALAALAATRERYFQLFLQKFDGNLCKDPVMCLTLQFWRKYWPELRRLIFCLRHPLAVARSMEKRYKVLLDSTFSVERGLELWYVYTTRFFKAASGCNVFVFDFDTFLEYPVEIFTSLLHWLGCFMEESEIREHLAHFVESEHVHWSYHNAELQNLPPHIRDLYRELRSHQGALQSL